ncbi:uncharacterized protein AB9W97_010153 isoform 2-T2 [Spinachia spinachia]
MKLLLSCLLLASLCALSSWSVSSAGEPAVSQTPDVSVVEGQTVEITCCWTLLYEKLRVQWKKNETEIKNSGRNALIASLAVVALLLITLVCVCSLQQRQVRAARVIYEVPNINSEEVEMDKHSTSSSRGSSQWCQVPVYESLDYFQHVETKESG